VLVLARWGRKLGLAKPGYKTRYYFEVLRHLVQIASACLMGRNLPSEAAGNGLILR